MSRKHDTDVDYCVRLGKTLAALRREKGLTQFQMAEKLGVSDNYISSLELGKSVFPVDLLRDYVHALELDPVVFLPLLEPDIITLHASRSLISSINQMVEDLSKL